VFYDFDGRLWVETWTGTGRAFDIFDPAGRQIASSNRPAGDLRSPFARGDRFYAIERDSLGVQLVKVFAIER
jgi:hypothetical protein